MGFTLKQKDVAVFSHLIFYFHSKYKNRSISLDYRQKEVTGGISTAVKTANERKAQLQAQKELC